MQRDHAPEQWRADLRARRARGGARPRSALPGRVARHRRAARARGDVPPVHGVPVVQGDRAPAARRARRAAARSRAARADPRRDQRQGRGRRHARCRRSPTSSSRTSPWSRCGSTAWARSPDYEPALDRLPRRRGEPRRHAGARVPVRRVARGRWPGAALLPGLQLHRHEPRRRARDARASAGAGRARRWRRARRHGVRREHADVPAHALGTRPRRTGSRSSAWSRCRPTTPRGSSASTDRGTLEVGMRADLNVVDLATALAAAPRDAARSAGRRAPPRAARRGLPGDARRRHRRSPSTARSPARARASSSAWARARAGWRHDRRRRAGRRR